MTDLEQKQIFSKNLTKYLNDANKTQKEVADAIGVSPQTFNTWCQAIALPRMGKVQLLADYFHISKTDLIDEPSEPLPAVKDTLVPRESRVIEKYRRLDEVDKGKIDERMDTMLEGEKYKKVELLDVREIS